jgi:hypothetical protein
MSRKPLNGHPIRPEHDARKTAIPSDGAEPLEPKFVLQPDRTNSADDV